MFGITITPMISRTAIAINNSIRVNPVSLLRMPYRSGLNAGIFINIVLHTLGCPAKVALGEAVFNS